MVKKASFCLLAVLLCLCATLGNATFGQNISVPIPPSSRIFPFSSGTLFYVAAIDVPQTVLSLYQLDKSGTLTLLAAESFEAPCPYTQISSGQNFGGVVFVVANCEILDNPAVVIWTVDRTDLTNVTTSLMQLANYHDVMILSPQLAFLQYNNYVSPYNPTTEEIGRQLAIPGSVDRYIPVYPDNTLIWLSTELSPDFQIFKLPSFQLVTNKTYTLGLAAANRKGTIVSATLLEGDTTTTNSIIKFVWRDAVTAEVVSTAEYPLPNKDTLTSITIDEEGTAFVAGERSDARSSFILQVIPLNPTQARVFEIDFPVEETYVNYGFSQVNSFVGTAALAVPQYSLISASFELSVVQYDNASRK